MSEYPEKGKDGDSTPQTTQLLQPQVAYQQDPHTVYMHTVPGAGSSNNIKHHYKGRVSVILGAALIILQTLALVINGVGLYFQIGRIQREYGNVFMEVFPAGWGAVLIYISAGFAIGSGKAKTTGLIIAHLVLAIISSVLAFVYLGLSIGAVILDVGDIQKADDVTRHEKGSLSMAVLMATVGLAEFVVVLWSAVLCYRVLCCCGRRQEYIVTAPVEDTPSGSTRQVEPVTPPPQYQP